MSDAGTTSLIFGVVIGTILCDYALTLLWLARQRRQASGRPRHRRQCRAGAPRGHMDRRRVAALRAHLGLVLWSTEIVTKV